MPEFASLSQRGLTDAEATISSYPVVELERWENALEVNFTFPGIWMGDPEPDLDGGSEGFDLIDSVIKTALPHLTSSGLIAFGVGHDQACRTCDMLAAHNYRDITAHADYQGIQRFVTARHG